jgi:hypothetical protein
MSEACTEVEEARGGFSTPSEKFYSVVFLPLTLELPPSAPSALSISLLYSDNGE